MHIDLVSAFLLLAAGASSYRKQINGGKQLHRGFDEARDKVASHTEGTAGTKSLLAAGSILKNRFYMLEPLWHESLGQAPQVPFLPLPQVVTERFDQTKELFAGAFGEVWKAQDIATGRFVAVKMFYKAGVGASGVSQGLTWQEHGNDENIVKHLEGAAAECKVARDIQAYADKNPKGASRLMQCYEDHATLNTSVTGHKVSKTDPLFLVLEFAGTTTLAQWMADNVKVSSTYFSRVKRVFKQLIEGLEYLMSHDDRWVHHDLKPDNIVIKESLDGKFDFVKIIDFGTMRKVSREAAAESITATPTYAPPECLDYTDFLAGKSLEFTPTGFNFDAPWSFDVYSVGVILVRLTTGSDFYRKLQMNTLDPSTAEVKDCMKNIIIAELVGAGVPRSKLENKSVDQIFAVLPRRANDSLQNIWNQCDMDLKCHTVKKKGGAEYNITANLGHEGAETKDEVASLMEFLLEKDIVIEGYEQVAQQYKEEAEESDWFTTFAKMIAYDPIVRVTPDEILASKFLENVDTPIDPDYHAEAAQKISEDLAVGKEPAVAQQLTDVSSPGKRRHAPFLSDGGSSEDPVRRLRIKLDE